MSFIELLKEMFGVGEFSFGRTLGAMRSNQWPKVRKLHMLNNPRCAVCDKLGTLLSPNEAHHCSPFHLHPELELQESNLITLCRRHHLEWGHLGSFKSFNKDVREHATAARLLVTNRP